MSANKSVPRISAFASIALMASGFPAAGQGAAHTSPGPATALASPLTVCGISGEVTRPVSISCADGILLKDAVETAGGFTSNADTGKITIVRGDRVKSAAASELKYDYKRVIDGKMQDITLFPGDLVMVPAKRKGVGFNLGRLLPPRQVQRDIEQFAKKNPVATGVVAATLGAVAYSNLRPHDGRTERQADQPEWLRRSIAAQGGGPNDPWRKFYENKAEAERQKAAAAGQTPQTISVSGAGRGTGPDSQKRAQIAQLVAMMQARARSQAVQRGATVPVGNTGGVESMIARLNSMSQADVNRLMSQPSIWDKFTPYWYKRDGGNVLGQAGVPSGLLRDLSRLDNLGDTATNTRINGQLRQVNALGALAGGMAAEQRVRNSSQAWFYKNLGEKDYDAISRQLIPIETRTGIQRP